MAFFLCKQIGIGDEHLTLNVSTITLTHLTMSNEHEVFSFSYQHMKKLNFASESYS